MYQVYGIPNCNTVKKALDWLSQHNIPFTFHNFKKEGIEATTLKNWCQQAGGWQNLLNKQGTTWRKLDANTQQSITTETKAIQLMQEMVSIIKRPVIVKGTTVVAIGFNEALYNTVFK